MSKELLTLLVAASPLVELRGAIPFAVFSLHLEPIRAFLISVIGNFIPIIPLLFFWKYFAAFLSRRSLYCRRFFAWFFTHTRRRHTNHFAVWKEIALLVFVAIPLPLTGAWSGTVAAFVFNVPLWRAALMIALGILIAGFVVLFLSQSVSYVL